MIDLNPPRNLAARPRAASSVWLLSLMVYCTFAPLTMSAATLYVWQDSPSPGPAYGDWASAAHTIQDAVDVAQAGDLVLVTNGVYASGGRAVGTNVLANRVAVDKPITLQSVNGPQVTIVEGAQAPGGGNGDGAIRCVYLTNGAGLSGLTLTNGATRTNGDYNLEQSGGGVWCESTNALVTNCTLTGNSATEGGGAYGGTLYNCTLTGNGAFDGGGASDGTLNNCTLTGNWGAYGGAAAYATLNNCTLTGNSAIYGGGASYATLNNCALTSNSANGFGGGGNMGGEGGGAYYSTLNNCTVTGNWVTGGNGGLGSGVYGGTLNNCIVYYNSGPRSNPYDSRRINHCCTPQTETIGGRNAGVGNITNAPLFIDLLGGNLRLQSNSPCINAGNNSYVTNATDLDGNPRIAGGTVDIGAYEFQAPVSMISYAWLQKYGVPINSTTDTADPDHDGVDNYHEWLAGSDPTNPFSFPPLLTLIPYGANVILTWTTNAFGFTLQSTTNPGSPAVWSTNSPAPVVIGGQNVIISPITGSQQFFQLSQ
jgi:hypothetical protein